MELSIKNEAELQDFNRAIAKWESAKAGKANVIVDDRTLDILSKHFREDDSLEATVYFSHSSSPMNPNQVGIRDPYILTLSQKGRDLLESEPVNGMRL
jgi:hypothetical protein